MSLLDDIRFFILWYGLDLINQVISERINYQPDIIIIENMKQSLIQFEMMLKLF